MREAVTHSAAETERLAAEMSAAFRGGEVVLLSGELGTGKTVFVRGLARGLGVNPDEVASPTFVILTSYGGRLTLHHADLYRLGNGGGDEDLGLDELPGSGGVLAVEWAERLTRRLWTRPMRVMIEHVDETSRRLMMEEEEE
ncbi:MAG: tRNA (adenosine(37)-N6)-threonylcarbamoyltransferase complex ATPase subunit type 1 TsaE [Vicinamibacteria bacterium]|nr:tRNA (adenosine(37)-N6)-threonylcarbamoyltransferase complex ATPase subunit type 1 TsaE [Vicinamibacteria bacterium]